MSLWMGCCLFGYAFLTSPVLATDPLGLPSGALETAEGAAVESVASPSRAARREEPVAAEAPSGSPAPEVVDRERPHQHRYTHIHWHTHVLEDGTWIHHSHLHAHLYCHRGSDRTDRERATRVKDGEEEAYPAHETASRAAGTLFHQGEETDGAVR